MKKIILALVALGFVGTANAANTEIMHQTNSGESELQFDFDYNSSSTDTVTAATGATASSTSITTMGLGVEYGMGINEMFAWTVGIGFFLSGSGDVENAAGTVTQEFDISGMTDIQAAVSGRYDLGMSMLQWNANLGFALGDRESDITTTSTPPSADIGGSSGRTALDLDLIWGYKLETDRMLGLRVATNLFATDASVSTTVDGGTAAKSDESGGTDTDFGFFYEAMGNEACVWGLEVTMASTSETEDTDANGNKTKGDGAKSTDLRLYSRSPMGGGNLLVGFTYSMIGAVDPAVAGSATESDGGSGMNLNIGWRMGL